MGRIHHSTHTVKEQDENEDMPRRSSQERAALKKRNSCFSVSHGIIKKNTLLLHGITLRNIT